MVQLDNKIRYDVWIKRNFDKGLIQEHKSNILSSEEDIDKNIITYHMENGTKIIVKVDWLIPKVQLPKEKTYRVIEVIKPKHKEFL